MFNVQNASWTKTDKSVQLQPLYFQYFSIILVATFPTAAVFWFLGATFPHSELCGLPQKESMHNIADIKLRQMFGETIHGTRNIYGMDAITVGREEKHLPCQNICMCRKRPSWRACEGIKSTLKRELGWCHLFLVDTYLAPSVSEELVVDMWIRWVRWIRWIRCTR